MAKIIRLIHDVAGETITVYFDAPEKAKFCEETGEGVILIKDKDDNVIGFEKLYFKLEENVNPVFQFETNLAKV